MSESMFKLTLDGSTFNLTDCVAENARVYAKTPRRALSGDLVLGNINTYFVPRLKAKITVMTDTDFKKLSKYVKGQSLKVEYYDDELGKMVVRNMTLNEINKGRLVINRYVGTEVSFESIDAYDTVAALTAEVV